MFSRASDRIECVAPNTTEEIGSQKESRRMNSRRGPGGWGFDAAYAGIPPWDIGRPQQTYVELAQTGNIQGSVLDVGCGVVVR